MKKKNAVNGSVDTVNETKNTDSKEVHIPIVADNDYAVSKIMVAMREVGNDGAFIEAMVGMLLIFLAKQNRNQVKNFVLFEDGAYCLNASDEQTISELKQKIMEGSE